MNITGKKVQFLVSFTVFVFMGLAVFNPIFNAGNVLIGLFFAYASAAITVFFSLYVYKKNKTPICKSSFVAKLLSILCGFFSVVSMLLLMTEIVDDTGSVAGKPMSREYYLLLSIALISVSLYLCFNNERGIYRFCSIAAFIVIIFVIACFFPLNTVNKVVPELLIFEKNIVFNSALTGIFTGFFATVDSFVFFYCFEKCIGFVDGEVKLCIAAITACFFLWSICIIICSLIFGSNLLCVLSDPIYSLTKVFRGFDITECLSGLRIIAFVIKSSVYMYSSAFLIKKSFCLNGKNSLKKIICILFSSVVIIFLPFLFLDDKKYGMFQDFLYPLVIFLSVLFAFAMLLRKTNE